jgi:hypothetical protein
MGYKLSIERHENNRINADAFGNFIMHYIDLWELEGSGFDRKLDNVLKTYGAKNILGEPAIEFETEQQALFFILRWS